MQQKIEKLMKSLATQYPIAVFQGDVNACFSLRKERKEWLASPEVLAFENKNKCSISNNLHGGFIVQAPNNKYLCYWKNGAIEIEKRKNYGDK